MDNLKLTKYNKQQTLRLVHESGTDSSGTSDATDIVAFGVANDQKKGSPIFAGTMYTAMCEYLHLLHGEQEASLPTAAEIRQLFEYFCGNPAAPSAFPGNFLVRLTAPDYVPVDDEYVVDYFPAYAALLRVGSFPPYEPDAVLYRETPLWSARNTTGWLKRNRPVPSAFTRLAGPYLKPVPKVFAWEILSPQDREDARLMACLPRVRAYGAAPWKNKPHRNTAPVPPKFLPRRFHVNRKKPKGDDESWYCVPAPESPHPQGYERAQRRKSDQRKLRIQEPVVERHVQSLRGLLGHKYRRRSDVVRHYVLHNVGMDRFSHFCPFAGREL